MSHFDTSSWRKCRITRRAVSHHYSELSTEAQLDDSGAFLTEDTEVLVEPDGNAVFWASMDGKAPFFLLTPNEFEEIPA